MADKPNNGPDAASDAPDGVLPLSYRVVTHDSEKQEALRLVADSIAQQRQTASAAIIFHPLCLAGLLAMCAGTYHQYQHAGYGTVMTMLSGVVIVYLSFVRFYTSGYIQRAESFRWRDFITGPDGREDTVIAAVYGKDVIGVLVLRLEGDEKDLKKKKKGGGAQAGKEGRGIIRAWTTKLRYRGIGVGSDLLHFAVQTTYRALGPDASVEFDPNHPNSTHPLPGMFLRPFKRRQQKAANALRQALNHHGNPE
ncbi:hypothetical protein BBK36DRAFT_1163013 [Trichoderma citrinoviride]|uniref:Uncharacterized protein n=1 Tax=Trichoderma citrinoviride TaxID=58853 RepID=A0A2T4AZD1_9HYPO|nr:hypothetical protein BBK36DRAFT_1163013 [Trichoderma citrinoviride]PTB62331.1 hypothetical protein BBK36DRAFT_1163013 [Trichoderma citrinoviride]